MSVGGNIQALLQVKKDGAKNAIGEREHKWVDCTSILGWLDLSTGDSKHTTFYAKVQESTHIFLCDFTSLKNLSTEWVWNPFSFLTGVISKTDEQEIEKGQRVEIDSNKRTIKLIKQNGSIENRFWEADKKSYIFEKIPTGENAVQYDGTFGFDLILLDRRSEPGW